MNELPAGWKLMGVTKTSEDDDDPDWAKDRVWVAIGWGPNEDEKWGWGSSRDAAMDELRRRIADPRPQFRWRGNHSPDAELQPDRDF